MSSGVELDSDQETPPPHLADQPRMGRQQRSQGGQNLLPSEGGVLDQAIRKQLDGGQGGGTTDRIAAKSGSVGSGRPAHQVGPGYHGPDRQSRGQALGGQQDVRFHPPVRDGPHQPGSTHASLDFVDDEKNAVLIADLTQPGQELGIRHHDAALTLDGFHDDGRHFVGRDQATKNSRLQLVETS